MIGRPYLYALAAAGEPGVDWLLDFLKDGVARTLALTGRPGISDLDESLLRKRWPDPDLRVGLDIAPHP
jgi:isopentenyl diphosphate isomerase/L-lactate dehydrogenase-like FMN-dependent dehydrogenase